MLQKEFGDGGSGFVLIARPWAWYNHRGVEMEASSNWKIDIAGIAPVEGRHARTGRRELPGHAWRDRALDAEDRSARNASRSPIWRSRTAAQFAVEADDQGTRHGRDRGGGRRLPQYRRSRFRTARRNSTFASRAARCGSTARNFAKAGPGVVYSSLGINGANVTLLSKSFNEHHWAAELRHYKPDLVIVNYGTNESGFADFVDKTWGPEMKDVVRRLHRALPDASILLMSPMDRGERNSQRRYRHRFRFCRGWSRSKLASRSETGAAFFNTFRSDGRAGNHGPLVCRGAPPGGRGFHPSRCRRARKSSGELLYNALRDGYNQYKLRQLKR